MPVLAEAELVPVAKAQRPQKRPAEEESTDQQRAMEEGLEVVARKKTEISIIVQPLRAPEEQRREDCAKEHGRNEVGQQLGCVFQETNVGLLADAESTHMEGKE